MIAWFARNGVAANLLMAVILFLGFNAVTTKIPLEVFPEFELDVIYVNIPFRGATPADVEEGVVIRAEEAIFDLEGIKELRSTATEGSATITVELEKGFDARELLDDVKNRIDAISTFPGEVERPTYSLAKHRREVISVVVAGQLDERELRRYGERVRDDIAALPGVTQVELEGVRPYEIAIEISENTLHQHGLTFTDVADAIRRASLDLSAGSIKTSGGEILLRTKQQAYVQEDFASIVILTREDGTRLTLQDIASVRDGFEENPVITHFNGVPAVVVEVYRIGDQNAIEVADAVKAYIASAAERFPATVELSYWRDRSRIVKSRLNTLVKSAVQGGILIFVLLALFFEILGGVLGLRGHSRGIHGIPRAAAVARRHHQRYQPVRLHPGAGRGGRRRHRHRRKYLHPPQARRKPRRCRCQRHQGSCGAGDIRDSDHGSGLSALAHGRRRARTAVRANSAHRDSRAAVLSG